MNGGSEAQQPIERVTIRWSDEALGFMRTLNRKVKEGILAQVRALRDPQNIGKVGKPLTGPLAGFRSIKYSRYRAIYKCERELLDDAEVLIHITVTFVMVGIRKEGDKKDVYRLAQGLVRWGTTMDEDD